MNQNRESDSEISSTTSTPRVNRPDYQDMIEKFENPNNYEIYEEMQHPLVTVEFLNILIKIDSNTAINNYSKYLKITNLLLIILTTPSNKEEIADTFLLAKNKQKNFFCEKILETIHNKDVLEEIKKRCSTPSSSLSNPFLEKLNEKIEKSNRFCAIS